MQLSAFEMIKKGETINIDVVDVGAREQINELNSSLNGKQNVVDNALMTTEKTIVGAINEINSDLNGKQNVGDNALMTTAKTIVGAINEINSDLTKTNGKLGLTGAQSAEVLWFGDPGQQRLEIKVIGIESRNNQLMLQASYDGTLNLYETQNGGASWNLIWRK